MQISRRLTRIYADEKNQYVSLVQFHFLVGLILVNPR